MEVPRILKARDEAEPAREEAGFWRRQFAPVVTRGQIIFDILFGVVAPILCFVFDPLVFRGWLAAPLFPQYQTFAYLFSGLQIMLLCLWLVSGPASQLWNQTLGSVLLMGALFCLAIGIILTPFTLMGLIFGIGMFGFTPFWSAFVYLRNSSRAFRGNGIQPYTLDRVLISVLAFVFAVGLPLMLSLQINLAVSRAVNEIVQGDEQHAIFAAHRVMPLRFFAESELDRLVTAYLDESDTKRKELLKSCYREITGDNIENRIPIVRD